MSNVYLLITLFLMVFSVLISLPTASITPLKSSAVYPRSPD